MQSLGDQIRALREQLGMTQAQLAERSGVGSQGMIAEIESGKRKNLELQTISKLAQALNCLYVSQLQPLKDIPEIIEEQSTNVAQKLISVSSGSAAIELQAPSQKSISIQIALLKKRLLESKSALWQRI